MSNQHTITYLFLGDPETFYDIIIAALPQYEIPNVAVEYAIESGGPGVGTAVAGIVNKFRGKAPPEAPPANRSLHIHDGTNRAIVTAFRYGASFFVSIRYMWASEAVAKRMTELIENDWRTYESQIEEICFNSVTRHIVRDALTAYIEASAERNEDDELPAPHDVFDVG